MFTFSDTGFAGKDALDTMTKSYVAMTKGFQAIAMEAADYSKKSFEDSVAHMQKLTGVRSIEAVVELQTSFLKSSYEGYVSEATKIGTMVTDLAKDSYKSYEAPMAQAANAVQTATKAAASAAKSAAA
ncbi:phasin family protein [Rhizobium sp. Leaf384]|uniref:phasin family protein n=1 Tax=unclassified Rhizobium TaxID=2613769 RepID=UPI000714FFCD|nr:MULTISPECIES: phasin family protein [unclassified Rhizobium]KQR68825.1 phasin family protein [Rhizobium sp. Leaf341]KQS79239.1 phasin family protein [Rhizobium sp. Leaf384]KQS82807.1 phasin family protein [Rhizobium sp. Leaf383]